jgi:hypothetical protein
MNDGARKAAVSARRAGSWELKAALSLSVALVPELVLSEAEGSLSP